MQIKGTKETWQLNTKSDPGLDPGQEKKKSCYKEHYWNNQGDFNMNAVSWQDSISVIYPDFDH